MIEAVTYNLILESLRVLFLLALPPIGATLAAGVISGLLQNVLAFSDPIFAYALRLIALGALAYFCLPAALRAMVRLTEQILA